MKKIGASVETKRGASVVALLGVAGLLGAILASTACSEPDWAGGDLGKKADNNTAAKADGGTDDEPEGCPEEGAAGEDEPAGGDDKPGMNVDLTKAAACCEDKGKAHCAPISEVSEGSRSKLNECSGGLCVPDSIIEGIAPKACTSIAGPGVCLSPCIKSVGEVEALLKPDVCGSGELCAPCEYGGKPTGACEIGKGGKSGGSKAKAKKKCAPKEEPAAAGDAGAAAPSTGGGSNECCGGKGACVPEAKVPEKQVKQLEKQTCGEAKLCAPKENIDPAFKPKSCSGKTLLGAYEGVCLSTCLNFSLLQSFASEQGDCDDDHRCLPCTIFGRPTGAPGCE